jgi:ComF family protein
LDAVWAAVDYSYPWSGLIIRFKFHPEIALASAFAQLMLSQTGAQRRLDTADWLVPMPMTPHRLGQRGYHPAWALTQALRRGGSPAHRPGALSNGLVRLSDGQQQHALSRQARLSNPDLRCVPHPEHATRWLDAHVLLIDDVCTTGASLQAAAQALRQAGAARVSAWVFARTRGSAVEPPL